MARNRISTKYPGVYFREVQRIGVKGIDEVFYIIFKQNGKTVEEKVGSKYADNMSAAKASGIRSDRMQGKILSRKDQLLAQEQAKKNSQEHITIAELWERYKILHADKKSLVTDGYNFLYLERFKEKHPEDIRTKDLTELKVKLVERGLKPATIKHAIVLLRMLMRFGVREGLCKMPEPSELYFEVPQLDNEKTEMLTAEQLIAFEKALQEEADQNAAAFMRLALATGMRKGALMNLRWDDIDFERGFITLRGDVAKKGKTEAIPLNATARNILLSVDKIGESLYVFPGKDGGPRKDFRRMAKRVKQKAGLPNDFRPLHGLRHTYASLLASSGKVDLYTLQKLLTHSSPQMTQRYAHLADEAMQKAANVIDDIFSQKE